MIFLNDKIKIIVILVGDGPKYPPQKNHGPKCPNLKSMVQNTDEMRIQHMCIKRHAFKECASREAHVSYA